MTQHHARRWTPDRHSDRTWTGTCTCGKRAYRTRGDAKAAARDYPAPDPPRTSALADPASGTSATSPPKSSPANAPELTSPPPPAATRPTATRPASGAPAAASPAPATPPDQHHLHLPGTGAP